MNKLKWAIVFLLFCVFWGISRLYAGPAYLSDEIGYLGHAALLAGYSLDIGTSWHAGYSLLLAPLFRVLPGPGMIWQGVLLVNALMWAASFAILFHLVDRFFPGIQTSQRILAVVMAALYPSWLAMSGYAFATTAFVLVFLLAILTGLAVDLERRWSVIPHTIATGFLYWIHPIGLAVALASIAALALFSVRKKRFFTLAFHSVLLAVILIGYNIGIHERLVAIATPPGMASLEHYPSYMKVISKVMSLEFWLNTALTILGQISYLIISSFGIALMGFIELINLVKKHFHPGTSTIDERGMAVSYSSLFIVLSMIGAIILGAAAIVMQDLDKTFDLWIYGRFAEQLLLPFLAFGFWACFRRWYLLSIAVGLVACGAALSLLTGPLGANNLINDTSFWPQYIIKYPDYLILMATGAAGVIIFQAVKQLRGTIKYFSVIVLIAAYVLSGVNAARWHQNILADYSRPSGLAAIVRDNFKPGSCVGFNEKRLADLEMDLKERYRLYVFYLYDYEYRRMSISDWLDRCDGPLFTYDITQLQDLPGIALLGREIKSGLYLVAKVREEPFRIPEEPRDGKTFYPGEGHSIQPQLYVYGQSLAGLPSQVGEFREGKLVSTGTSGFLIFGPYVPMNAGEYRLVVRGAAPSVSSAWVDIVSRGGSVQHARSPLNQTTREEPGVLASIPVLLDEPVNDLEVRVNVGANDVVFLDGYELIPVAGSMVAPQTGNSGNQ